LVVPNNLYARVKEDGSFKLEGVPVGSRRVAAWAPGSAPAKQTVELTEQGAKVDLTLDAASTAGHMNKFGQPYGSYD
jgi:hypothetical protein